MFVGFGLSYIRDMEVCKNLTAVIISSEFLISRILIPVYEGKSLDAFNLSVEVALDSIQRSSVMFTLNNHILQYLTIKQTIFG